MKAIVPLLILASSITMTSCKAKENRIAEPHRTPVTSYGKAMQATKDLKTNEDASSKQLEKDAELIGDE